MTKWIDLVRALIRPYISVTGWTAFLIVVVVAMARYMDEALAKQLAVGFMASVSTIVGVWLGSRQKPGGGT